MPVKKNTKKKTTTSKKSVKKPMKKKMVVNKKTAKKPMKKKMVVNKKTAKKPMKKKTAKKTMEKKITVKKPMKKKVVPAKKKAMKKVSIKKNTGKSMVKKKVARKSPASKLPKNEKEKLNLPKIKVVGVGGSGKNATNYMIKKDIKNVKFVVINTDTQDLNQSKANKKIAIGKNLTNGSGTGINPEIGKKAALESKEEIANSLKDSQIVFLTGGMGGGTGTGATPVIASIARELGILTIAIVTTPFEFEGQKRKELAKEGIESLSHNSDAFIFLNNENILAYAGDDASMEDAFAMSDEVLRQSVEGISDLITKPGRINIDYADIKSVLKDSGEALIGIGSARGKDRASKAANLAINSPLIKKSTEGAKYVIFSIAHNDDLKMSEISEIAREITKDADPDAVIKFGTVRNNSLVRDQIKITVVASKFDGNDVDISESKSFGLSSFKKDSSDSEEEMIEEENKDEDLNSFPSFFKRKK